MTVLRFWVCLCLYPLRVVFERSTPKFVMSARRQIIVLILRSCGLRCSHEEGPVPGGRPAGVREALKAHLKSPILDAVYVTEAAFDRHEDIAELLEQVWHPTPEEGRAFLCVW